jgi:hypothetical protein
MVKAKAMGLFRDSQGHSWLSEPRTDVPAESSSHRRWLSALLRFMEKIQTKTNKQIMFNWIGAPLLILYLILRRI